MERIALIVAGGSGIRFNSTTPKQFIPIAGKPVLMHSIDAFHSCSSEIKIVVSLPGDSFNLWDDLCRQYNFTVPHTIVEGGETRFHSVKNGINRIAECMTHGDEDFMIAVHDGVRPLITPEMIVRLFEYAETHGNAVPAIPINDSVREKITDAISHSVERKKLRVIQTPQCFKLSTLRKAYMLPYNEDFTDDANVVGTIIGEKIHLVEGDIENLKITRPVDFKVAQVLLNEKMS